MLEGNPSGGSRHARHRLAWLDQLAFELFRATGRNQLMQCIWLYDREVDIAALTQTSQRFAETPFNRLIEPSPLPLARPRWVRPAGASPPPFVSSQTLPRGLMMRWADEQARMSIDPVAGPAGRMSVQRFDDGSSAVSIVMSHVLLDGIGALRAIELAAAGTGWPVSYEHKGARGALAGSFSDALQILGDAPRTLAALARLARESWRASPAASRSGRPDAGSYAGPPEVVDIPAVAASIDTRLWSACEQRLGGGMNSLLPGFVARLATHLGRRRASDGFVSLVIPINRREAHFDERALAIDFHTMHVAPENLTTNLQPIGVSFKSLLRGARDKQADPLEAVLPAVAWMPRTLAKTLVNRLFNYAEDLPVTCSEIGVLPYALGRIDGAPCQRMLTRGVDVNVSRLDLERSRGHLLIVASRYNKTISLCIEGCQLHPSPTRVEQLRAAVERTLGEFGLEASIEA